MSSHPHFPATESSPAFDTPHQEAGALRTAKTLFFVAAGGAYVALRSGFAHGWMRRHPRRPVQSPAFRGTQPSG